MSYEFYKVIHLAGILMVFFGLAGILAMRMTTATLPRSPYLLFVITHGVGLLFALVAGFGLAARLGLMSGLPGWVWMKIAIWLILGGVMTLAKRKGYIGWPLLVSFLALGAAAAWLAIMKPF